MINLLTMVGASGYTATKAAGFGRHGSSRPGLVEAGNVRVEVLRAEEPARAMLKNVVHRFAGQQIIAFMVDAEAVPAEHFERPEAPPPRPHDPAQRA